MSKYPQDADGKGSLLDIQRAVNEYPHLLDRQIQTAFPELADDVIIWQSPLKIEHYAEYRDDDFINAVGLDPRAINLTKFWPKRGPQWDALATIDTTSAIILVEAKANIPEVITPGTNARSKSRQRIISSLNETKAYLGIVNYADWSGKYYQYTNRLAHLFFLRIKKEKPAYLVNVYFVGDESVSGPQTEEEWKVALQTMHSHLGIGQHKLSKYIADIFIHVSEIGIGK